MSSRLIDRRIWGAMLGLLLTAGAHATSVIGPITAAPADISPGELLFGELNCAACHKVDDALAQRLNSREGPLLGEGGMRITAQYLRRFLASPHQYKPGTLMPDLIQGLPENQRAEAVDALVHFLISAQAQATAPGMTAEDSHLKRGETLFHTIGCVACHAPMESPAEQTSAVIDSSLQGTASVPLGDLARKTTVAELARFLADPSKARPSGRMPSMNLDPGEAVSLATYLLRAQIPSAANPAKIERVEGVHYQYYEHHVDSTEDLESLTPVGTGMISNFKLDPRKRETDFGFRFTGSLAVSQGGKFTFYTYSDDGSRLYIDGKLIVDNDREHAPAEKRGTIDLTAGDHAIQVSFFQSGAGHEFNVRYAGPGIKKQEIPTSVLSHIGKTMTPLDSEAFTVDREKANKGRQLFAALSCAACHKVGGETVAYKSAKAFPDLTAGLQGCLDTASKPGVPKFDLDQVQRNALRDFLTNKGLAQSALTPAAQISSTMARLNCYACHVRDGKGGPVEARLAYFRVVGEADLGDEGRIPPLLGGAGAKLRPEWIHEVLANKGFVRPYMATRMPQFKEERIAALPGLFVRADAVAQPTAAPETTQRDAKFGRRLVGSGGLVCISCHTFADHKSLGIPAIDLTRMTERLNYDWFHRYLIDPAALRPGTRMPTFWPNGVAANTDILNGNTDQQIRSIWAYLSLGKTADLPSGLIQGRKEIVAGKEPVVYRNFIQGAGSRAIGVGYPEKVNLAFDANNMRLALIWQGAFIDAARHSTGRGEGFEPPLGNNVYPMPEGAEFAILNTSEMPWPSETGKTAGYQMRGYELDGKRRPSFLYDFRGVHIEDGFVPVVGELDASLRRTITLSAQNPPDNFWFRAAVGSKIDRAGEDAFVVDGKMNLKFEGLAGGTPVIRQSGGRSELLIPIRFNQDRARIVEEMVW